MGSVGCREQGSGPQIRLLAARSVGPLVAEGAESDSSAEDLGTLSSFLKSTSDSPVRSRMSLALIPRAASWRPGHDAGLRSARSLPFLPT